MHPRQDPSADLLSLAALQAGVLSLPQIAGHGLSQDAVARLVRQGHWQRLARAVYLASAQPADWHAQAWAGLLIAGPQARLGGSAAGFLHGLQDSEPWPVTVLVPAGQTLSNRHPWWFRREGNGVRAARSPGSPPRTTVEDTVLDLCDDGDFDEAVGWVTRAVQKNRTTVRQLQQALRQRQRARHRKLLQDLLGDVAHGVESPLELRYLRDVERPHGLPVGQRQGSGQTPFRRDVSYPRYRLVVELDGRLGHDGTDHFRDMERDNLTTAGGERTLRYGAADVSVRPCRVAWQVASVLQQQGWDGWPSRCPRCPDNPWPEGA